MQIKNLLDKIDNYRQEEIKEKQKKETLQKLKSQKNDTISISPKAKLFATILKEAKNAPEVRIAKIEKLKEQIHTGQYHPDPQKIAQKILEEDHQLWD
ncbi:anti-sigma-28 factor, FlgM family [Desulfonauticus submarinus]|uniref:Negative regulator of flagellin synthesis n=1 Tax=Desulfonauticus submarinus TaxID=206665 RepID=A0A1H0AJQ9_9BACT|nr:flagellar biosynthesis anti-sigma factor FlgM [Desulfonauticus submarinus]SDN33601.1 anti-sigma-28 factor, FlgM family [Desulfonauticus submarinus]